MANKTRQDEGALFSEGARLLREALAKDDLSQGKAAQMLGVLYPDQVNRWVHGDRKPGLKHASAIEREFGIPMIAWTQEAAQ